MKAKIIVIIAIIVLVAFVFTGCLPGDGKNTADNPGNFLTGIWHGWVAPISIIGGLFNSDIRVYEAHNTGWWYDFGFYIAVISGFGGISLFRWNNRRRRNDNQ